MLLVCEPIPVGTPVIVRIEIEDRKQFVEAAGQVRWCEQDGRNDKDFHAGIEFAGLAPEELRKIDRMREWFNSPDSKNSQSTPRSG